MLSLKSKEGFMFKRVTAITPSNNDELSKHEQMPFFRDALVAPLSHEQQDAKDIQYAIFGYMPNWVHTLMSFRNKLVKKLGFKVGVNNMAINKHHLKAGDQVGFMTIKSITTSEVICFAEDKHMDFYLSVSKENKHATISTLVNQKTLIGRLYVNAILPFHYFIARIVINNAIKNKRI